VRPGLDEALEFVANETAARADALVAVIEDWVAVNRAKVGASDDKINRSCGWEMLLGKSAAN
jgi:hypothetical protein